MPRDTSDIGSHGLEQGGGNLGNDISRRVTTDRNEQNTTTNPGSHPGKGNQDNDKKGSFDTSAEDEGGSLPDSETVSLNEDDEEDDELDDKI